jgi:tRNA-specific adenosine deaminase 3
MGQTDHTEPTSEALELTRHAHLAVRADPLKGRGVYATHDIPSNSLVEVSPVLLIPASEYSRNRLDQTILESYLFTWNRSGVYALALGLGSLFNHSSDKPNVSYVLDKENNTIRYTTKRTIKEGEELCIFYGHGVVFGEKGELLVKKDPPTPEDETKTFELLGSLEP